MIIVLLLCGLFVTNASAQDIRSVVKKAEAEREQARISVEETEFMILNDKQLLTARVDSLEALGQNLAGHWKQLRKQRAALEERMGKLEEQWSEQELDFKETTGNVRLAARDVVSMLKASSLSAGRPERVSRVAGLLEQGYFPDIDDISMMTAVLMDEFQRSGQVTIQEKEFIGRDGEQTAGNIFQLGKFTSLYELPTERGFLTHSPESQDLFALPELPGRRLRSLVGTYLDGDSDMAPVDLSGGSALRQISTRTSFGDQVRAGGPLVWPILLLAVIALGIVAYRLIFLHRVHANTDKLMGQFNNLAAQERWHDCNEMIENRTGRRSPVVRVIKAALKARGSSREVLESVLQEAILHELPTLQKGLAILAIFGAIAPLLGLLGTVTGMIETFRVITVYGTGDPKLMSGGISEALVTTELGLIVAIPIMLFHTILSRQADHVIGDMEKQAVHMTNVIVSQEK